MKVAVSVIGNDLDAVLDPRFGRCPGFVIVDTRDMSYEAIVNAGASAGAGGGLQAVQSLSDKGVEAVITGQCGPNATSALDAAGIRVYTDQAGKVRDLVDQLNQGKLTPSPSLGAPVRCGQRMGRGIRGVEAGVWAWAAGCARAATDRVTPHEPRAF